MGRAVSLRDFELQGGARWAYVFGSGLVFVLLAQLVTGALLALTYVPTVHGAWASVFQVQDRATLGGFVRGLHRHGASAMMLVMGVHLLQVAAYGAYQRPRAAGWWTGLVLMSLILGLGFTGYVLPWDQDGYWATNAAAGLAARTPFIGPVLRDLLFGGPACGQGTLTRMFLMHVGVLPGLVGASLLGHAALFRRRGPTAPAGADLACVEPYRPAQLRRDLLFSFAVLCVLALVTVRFQVPLGAPADAAVVHPARPAGYFLWLFQLLRLVPRPLEWVVTLALPLVGGGLLVALPFLDRRPTTRVRERWLFVAPVVAVVIALPVLTAAALGADGDDPVYQALRQAADVRASRSIALARRGIPSAGPIAMLADDPRTRGADLVARECARCHVLEGRGERWAPEHTGFGSREWVRGQLHDPNDARHFGLTRLVGMPSQDRLGDAQLTSVTEFVFSLGREPQDPPVDALLVARGALVFQTKCMTCHTFEGGGDSLAAGGPDMTGYASRTWIARWISGAAGRHGRLGESPLRRMSLSQHDLRMVAAYLRLQRFARVSAGPLVPPLSRLQRAMLRAHEAEAREHDD